MHVIIAIWTLLAAWRWGDWKHFEKYHKTLLFIVSAGLLYEFVSRNYILWEFSPGILKTNLVTDIVYIFVIMPFSVLVFLSTYPESSSRQILHIGKWVLIYGAVEWIGSRMGGIYYRHGWNVWWSIAFDCQMFPMLRLHFKKPVWAYALSFIVVTFFMWKFHVPLH